VIWDGSGFSAKLYSTGTIHVHLCKERQISLEGHVDMYEKSIKRDLYIYEEGPIYLRIEMYTSVKRDAIFLKTDVKTYERDLWIHEKIPI